MPGLPNQLGLVHPRRGVPDGYRSYTPADVRTARLVQQLRLAGYRPDQIRDVLRDLDAAKDSASLHLVLARRTAALEERSGQALRGDARLAAYLDDHQIEG